jgi:hypothetical protein
LSCFLDRRSSVLKHWNFSEPGSSHAAYAIKIYWMKSETNGYTGHTIQHNPKHLFTLYIYILLLDNNNIYIYHIYLSNIWYIYPFFWVQKSWSHRVIFVDFRRSPGVEHWWSSTGFPSWDDTQNSAPGWDPTNPMDAGKRLHKQWYHNI